MVGTSTTSPQMEENESPTVAITPESVRFLNVRNTRLNTKVTTVEVRNHHQNSLREARPLNTAYFLKKRTIASPRLQPYAGMSSGAVNAKKLLPDCGCGAGCP